AEEIVAPDRQRGIVARRVRRTDLHRELRELLLRLCLGFRAHPLQAVYADPVGIDQVLHERIHPRFRLGLEVPGDVERARRFAELRVGAVHRALPAWGDLLLSGQRLAAKREARLDEGGWQLIREL